MIGQYKLAHVLGVTRGHESVFREIERELTQQGYIVFCPAIYDYDIYVQHKDILNDMCSEKLKVCDFCVLATPEHVGLSTRARIRQAFELDKPVYVWNRQESKLGHALTEDSLQMLIDISVPFSVMTIGERTK